MRVTHKEAYLHLVVEGVGGDSEDGALGVRVLGLGVCEGGCPMQRHPPA